MKTILIPIALITTLLVVGCQKDITEETTALAYDKEAKIMPINEDYAIRTAKDFIGNFSKATRAMNDKKIGDVYALCNDKVTSMTRSAANDNDTIAYIVNFDNDEGFLLIDSRDTVGHVLAYVEEGHLAPGDEIGNPGFKQYLDFLKLYPGVISDPIIPFVDSTHVGLDPVGPRPNFDDREGYWQIDSVVPTLLTTKWGQEEPFNTYCYTNTGQNAVAGCLPIAIAQVAAYNRCPEGVNWNLLLAAPLPVSDAAKHWAASFVAYIGSLMPTIVYGVNSTSATLADGAACLDDMGYTYSLGPLDFSGVMSQVSHYKPVIITGFNSHNYYSGHAWVIDGAIIRNYYSRLGLDGFSYNVIYTQQLVHCNWGWYGQYDGYYSYNLLKLSEKVLNDDLTEWNGSVSYDQHYDYNINCFYDIIPED